MQITINGENEQIAEEGVTVTRLLEIKNVESPDMVSVQVNGVFCCNNAEVRLYEQTVEISTYVGK